MKIKRFFAPDIRRVMQMVKDELGADAVIMSNRSVDNGVEIVAAKDFDEQLIHDELKQSPPVAKKKVGLGNLQPGADVAHIVTSKRKRQVDGSAPRLSKRMPSNQYIGYAEKVALDSSKRDLAALRANQYKPSNALEKKSDNSSRISIAAVDSKPANPLEQGNATLNANLLAEMRNEISQLKTVLEDKFAAAGWAQEASSSPVHLDLLRQLGDIGIAKPLAIKIANRLGSHTDVPIAWAKAQEMLATLLPITEDPILDTGGIFALVGPTGVGKTTTIAKLAAKFILQHGSRQVALISTDNYRISAHEQLKTYGRILDVPVSVAVNSEQLRAAINRYNDKRLILIDTAGMSQRDMRLGEQISILQQSQVAIKSYLVMSATAQFKATHEIIDAFKVFNPVAGIVTKMDEAALKGAVLSALVGQQLPLAYVTNGQQVPEDIEVANAAKMVAECVAELEKDNSNYDTESYEHLIATGYA
jgi:flagellar biosynthesis protein FlhF